MCSVLLFYYVWAKGTWATKALPMCLKNIFLKKKLDHRIICSNYFRDITIIEKSWLLDLPPKPNFGSKLNAKNKMLCYTVLRSRLS